MFIVYEIRNKINNMIYVGMHKCDDDEDYYMGSGTKIREAIIKFGREKFEKRTLYSFSTKEEMIAKEAEIVNDDFVDRLDTYNMIKGGVMYSDHVLVVNKNGKYLKVDKNDERISIGELFGISKNKVVVRDEEGNRFIVKVDDPRYLKGELKFTWVGRKHAEIAKRKIGEKNSKNQSGSGNSQFGKIWIFNEQTKQNNKIPKNDLDTWISNGWKIGRKMKYTALAYG